MATFILGDVHGEFEAMSQILCQSGLTYYENGFLHWKKKCKDTLIQVGDVVDGGKESVRCYKALQALQIGAVKEKGRVIRLLGDHELGYIGGPKCEGSSVRIEELLADEIRQDILDGNLLAIWGIFTKNEICWVSHAGFMYEIKNEDINEVFLDFVSRKDFGCPIFAVGRSRGGKYDHGGIFWADWHKDLIHTKYPYKQIVGHTVVDGITFRNGNINVDCGIGHKKDSLQILKYDNGTFTVLNFS